MTAGAALRLGTRASPLARWQAEWVAAELGRQGVSVELVPISTQGDRQRSGPIGAIGVEGVFTKELQRALLASEIDLAVHSLKDLPTDPVAGLGLAATPRRGPHCDALVSLKAASLDDLPKGAVVGTGSLRRRSQLWNLRPDLRMADIRGNVETRLRKLQEGEFDALILAEAGLTRLGLAEHIRQVLSPELMTPAVGQGALGIEARLDDAETVQRLAPLNDPATHNAVLAERAMLAALHGGCLAPVGAWGRPLPDGQLGLTGVVLSADGQQRLFAEIKGDPHEAAELGKAVAADLILQGATDLIEACRKGARPA